MVHGFYAGMGGFAFPPDDLNATRDFLTAHGALVLAELDLLPDISEEQIRDKSKADSTSKAIALLQASWLIIQSAGRVAVGLPVSLLEIHTIAHVLCAFIIWALWWRKPMDVIEPTLISCNDLISLRESLRMFSSTKRPSGDVIMGDGNPAWCEGPEVSDFVFIEQKPASESDEWHGNVELDPMFMPLVEMVDLKTGNLIDAEDGKMHVGTMMKGTDMVLREDGRNACCAATHDQIGHFWVQASDNLHRWRAACDGLRRYRCIWDRYKRDYEFPDGCRPSERFSSHHACYYPLENEDEAQRIYLASALRNSQVDGKLYPNDAVPMKRIVVLCIATVYGAVHCAGWRADFPSETEQWFWWGSSVALSGPPVTFLTCAVLEHVFELLLTHSWNPKPYTWQPETAYIPRIFLPEFPRSKDPASVSTWGIVAFKLYQVFCGCAMLLWYSLCFGIFSAWLLGRSFVVIEVFIGLRSMPSAMYQTPQWSQYIPHV